MAKVKPISKRFQDARWKLSLSQSKASKAWGISLKTLQSWEQEASNPRGLYLEKAEAILKSVGA